MMLPFFPAGSLAGSVDAAVWVGVCVVCFFNLRLGWVLSGLVVPGYLVPLLLTRPWSAGAVVVEAVVTYAVVWFFSEVCSRAGLWTNLFGRDRFFGLLVTSVLVRAVFDTLLFPALGEFLNQWLLISFDYQNNLHSFGLIVVALIANQFWKPGLLRGIFPLVVTVGLTFLLVRFGLMEFTNFSIGNLAYMYEDLAVSMLASPKAYIILLTTAYVASRMNLLYGWDFSGILIPALLALQWHEPFKIVVTVGESLIILVIASLVLRLPFFQSMTMDGGRKLLLFFSFVFVWKILLGHLLPELFPVHKISDFYGFGYLLTTLLAMKMHDKDIVARMTRATLQTSLTSLAWASVFGFLLTFVPNVLVQKEVRTMAVAGNTLPAREMDSAEALQAEKLKMYSSRRNPFVPPTVRDLEVFSLGLKSMQAYLLKRDAGSLEQASALFRSIGFSTVRLQEGEVLVSEGALRRGWGSYLFNPAAVSRLAVEIPAPLDEQGIMEAGVGLFHTLSATALAVAGASRYALPGGAADPLLAETSFMDTFQRIFGGSGILQVRGLTVGLVRRLTGERIVPGFLEESGVVSSLWITGGLSSELPLAGLGRVIGEFDIRWKKPPVRNLLRDRSEGSMAELFLDRNGVRSLRFRPSFVGRGVALEQEGRSIVGHLQAWLLTGKGRVAPRGSGAYRAPSTEELLYLDQEVLTPLLEVSDREYVDGVWTRAGKEEVDLLSAAAGVVGYRVTRYRHLASGRDFLILAERDDAESRRSWGTYVFRLGPAEPLVLQLPRPLSEVNVFEYGVSLFERTSARALLIGGAHPGAVEDGSADLLRFENRANVFNLVAQVLLRESRGGPVRILQCRAFGLRPDRPVPEGDVIFSLQGGLGAESDMWATYARVIDLLRGDGLRVDFVDGSAATAGYAAGGIPQSQAVSLAEDGDFAVMWLSPEARMAYRQQAENLSRQSLFAAMGVSTEEGDLADLLLQAPSGPSADLPREIVGGIEHYMRTQDAGALQFLVSQKGGFDFLRFGDLDSHHAFLILRNGEDRIVAVANLFPRRVDSVVEATLPLRDRGVVSRFIDSRSAWLRFGK